MQYIIIIRVSRSALEFFHRAAGGSDIIYHYLVFIEDIAFTISWLSCDELVRSVGGLFLGERAPSVPRQARPTSKGVLCIDECMNPVSGRKGPQLCRSGLKDCFV